MAVVDNRKYEYFQNQPLIPLTALRYHISPSSNMLVPWATGTDPEPSVTPFNIGDVQRQLYHLPGVALQQFNLEMVARINVLPLWAPTYYSSSFWADVMLDRCQ